MTTRDGIQAQFKLSYSGFALDVDLALPGRGISAIYGASGSGKTSLLRCIAGLDRAVGQLCVNGEVWQDESHFLPPHQRSLGYVFQEASLFAHLTVRGNLDYGLNRLAPAQRKVSLDHALDLLGIAHLMERKPEGLSGGERQRVAIARALLTSPRLLLMDEPLAALDLPRKREILPYLERLHTELDIPLLYVSHSPDELARLADHLVVLELGPPTSTVFMPRRLAVRRFSRLSSTITQREATSLCACIRRRNPCACGLGRNRVCSMQKTSSNRSSTPSTLRTAPA